MSFCWFDMWWARAMIGEGCSLSTLQPVEVFLIFAMTSYWNRRPAERWRECLTDFPLLANNRTNTKLAAHSSNQSFELWQHIPSSTATSATSATSTTSTVITTPWYHCCHVGFDCFDWCIYCAAKCAKCGQCGQGSECSDLAMRIQCVFLFVSLSALCFIFYLFEWIIISY